MSAARKIVIVLAAVAALAAWFVVRAMMAKPAAVQTATVAAPAKPTVQVLTAKRDLAVGARLSAADMGWQDWPADSLNPAFITDGAPPEPEKKKTADKVVQAAGQMLTGSAAAQALEGAVVREPILAGEPILARKIVRGGEGGYMAAVLRPGMRAVAVPISAANAAAGFILPGDHVDVMQSHEVDLGLLKLSPDTSNSKFAVETVLANIRVLAVDQTATPEKDAKTVLGAVATLEVMPGDAEVLMRAKSQGDLVLALRSVADGGGRSGAPAAAGKGASNIVRVHRPSQTVVQGVRQ